MKWIALTAVLAAFCLASGAQGAWPSIFDDRTAIQGHGATPVSSSEIYATNGVSYSTAFSHGTSCCDSVWAGYCSEPGHGHCWVPKQKHFGGCGCGNCRGGFLGGILGIFGGHHSVHQSGCATCDAGAIHHSEEMIIIDDGATMPNAAPLQPTPDMGALINPAAQGSAAEGTIISHPAQAPIYRKPVEKSAATSQQQQVIPASFTWFD